MNKKFKKILSFTILFSLLGSQVTTSLVSAQTVGANMTSQGAQALGSCLSANVLEKTVVEFFAYKAKGEATAISLSTGVNSPDITTAEDSARSSAQLMINRVKDCSDLLAQGMYKGILVDINQSMYTWAKSGFKGSVYLMPQGGVVAPYEANRLNIANICCKQGWNYSPRLHVDLWGNSWGT